MKMSQTINKKLLKPAQKRGYYVDKYKWEKYLILPFEDINNSYFFEIKHISKTEVEITGEWYILSWNQKISDYIEEYHKNCTTIKAK